ncbi:Putative Uncharacterized protein [Clostridium chauvoei JF4335]|nr:Putative Uncharacterized protein [Clostridium chauvoei JF4335]
MIGGTMKKNINTLLTLGFSIALFTISFIISSNYINIKYVIDENKFNDTFSYLDIHLQTPLSLLESNKLLKSIGINKYATQPSLVVNRIGETDYANKLIGVSENFNIEDYFNIEWLSNGKNDFYNRTDVVIIGNSLMQALNKLNSSTEYIEIQGENRKIAGVLKDSQYASFMTFMPIEYLRKENELSNIIQCFVDKNTNIAFGNLKGAIHNSPAKNVLKFAIDKSMTIEGEIVDIILGILTIVIFSICYVQINKRKFSIMRLVGAKQKHILYEYIRCLLPMFSIAFFIAIYFSSITINYISNNIDDIFFKVDLINICMTGIIGFILILLTSLLCMINTLRFRILEDIR